MIDPITEIPLPGRTLACYVNGAPPSSAGVTLPAFVAGPENRLIASTFCRLLKHAQLEPAASPHVIRQFRIPTVLAVFGSSGAGKTHLARGLVRHWQNSRGNDAALYFTAQDFRHQFAEAMSTRKVTEFRRRLRSHELLAIDDLHALPSDDYLLQELRYTLDAFEETGGTVVVNSTRAVTSLPNLSPDLRTRLASGLMLQLALPGPEARLRIVQHVSSALNRPLSAEAIARLANGLHGTASHLVGALFELWAELPAGRPASAEHADGLLAGRAARQPALREIVAVVARYYKMPQKQLQSKCRRQSIVRARATVAFLARELTDQSYEQIGQGLGGRDHTTIMHSNRRIKRDLQHDLALQEAVEDLRRILLSQ